MFKKLKNGPKVPKVESNSIKPDQFVVSNGKVMSESRYKQIQNIKSFCAAGLGSAIVLSLAYVNGNFSSDNRTVIGTNPQKDIATLTSITQEIQKENGTELPTAIQIAIKQKKGERASAQEQLLDSNLKSLLSKCDSKETYQLPTPKKPVEGRDLTKINPKLLSYFAKGIRKEDQGRLAEFKSFILQTQKDTGAQVFISERVKLEELNTKNSLDTIKKSLFMYTQTIKATNSSSIYKGVSLYEDSDSGAHKTQENQDSNDYVGINARYVANVSKDVNKTNQNVINSTFVAYHEIIGHWGVSNVSNRLRACMTLKKMQNTGQSLPEATSNLNQLISMASEGFDYSSIINDKVYSLADFHSTDIDDQIANELAKSPKTFITGKGYSIINFLKVAANQVKANIITKRLSDRTLSPETRDIYINLYNSLPTLENPLKAFSMMNHELESTSVEVLGQIGINKLDDKAIKEYIDAQIYTSGATGNVANTDFEYIKLAIEYNWLTNEAITLNTQGPLRTAQAADISKITTKMQNYLRQHKRPCTDADFRRLVDGKDLFNQIKAEQANYFTKPSK